MNFDLRPFVAIWAVIAAAVAVLVVRRKMVTRDEEDSVHVLEGGAAVSSHQVALAQKLEVIDKWGKILTAIAVITGLLLLVLWAYQLYLSNSGLAGA